MSSTPQRAVLLGWHSYGSDHRCRKQLENARADAAAATLASSSSRSSCAAVDCQSRPFGNTGSSTARSTSTSSSTTISASRISHSRQHNDHETSRSTSTQSEQQGGQTQQRSSLRLRQALSGSSVLILACLAFAVLSPVPCTEAAQVAVPAGLVRAHERVVNSSAELASALEAANVYSIIIPGTIKINGSHWIADGRAKIYKNVTIWSDQLTPGTLNFDRLQFAMVVQSGGALRFQNMVLDGLASSMGPTVANLSTIGGIGQIWPSISVMPSSQLFLTNDTIYYFVTPNWVNCTQFGERYSYTYGTTYQGNTSVVGDSVVIDGTIAISLAVITVNNTQYAELYLTNTTNYCDASSIALVAPAPSPTASGSSFPPWKAVAIAVPLGIVALLASLVGLGLYLRHRKALKLVAEAQAGGYISGSNNTMQGSGQRRSGGASATVDELRYSSKMEGGDYEQVPALLKLRSSGTLDGVELGPLLGRGSFGRVYKGRWKGAIVAVKVVAHSTKDGSPEVAVVREGILSASVSHPNVVATYRICNVSNDSRRAEDSGTSGSKNGSKSGGSSGSVAKGTSQLPLVAAERRDSGTGDTAMEDDEGLCAVPETWMLLEFCDRGSLERALQNKRFVLKETGKPDLPNIYRCLLDIAAGMDYLHSVGILHSDLKTENVLLKSTTTNPRGFICKIADFGLSRVLNADNAHLSTQTYGTVSYMPPELLEKGQMTKSVDVYSFGILMWELVKGSHAFMGLTQWQVLHAVVNKDQRPDVLPDMTPGYAALMTACWQRDPKKRPTFESISVQLEMLLKDHLRPAPPAQQASLLSELAKSFTKGRGNRQAGQRAIELLPQTLQQEMLERVRELDAAEEGRADGGGGGNNPAAHPSPILQVMPPPIDVVQPDIQAANGEQPAQEAKASTGDDVV